MIQIRRADERGHANHGWLDSWHSFSFADYHDPEHMGWGTLRVINEDRVAPGMGFGTHGHRDMEIISYVLEGALEHKDSVGNGAVVRPNEVQRMSAGKGVLHSEFNPSASEPVHFLQIWIRPNAPGIRPSYEQRFFAPDEKLGRLRLVASGGGRDGSVTLNQDADVLAALLEPGQAVSHGMREGRLAYVHVARGEAALNGTALSAGDGAKVANERKLDIVAAAAAEILVFDMPAGR